MSDASTLSGRLRSFCFALEGLRTLLATQPNARIHACATLAVVVAGFGLGVSATQGCVLALATALVWAAEAINTALEFLADVVSPEPDPLIKQAKDVAAAGVLMAAVAAVVVAALVFGPILLARLS